MSTVRYWTDLVRTHRRPSVCKEKRQPHNSSAGFLYWRTQFWFCIVFQLFNPGLLRLHRAVHNVACGGSPLWRLSLRGDDGLLPDHGRLRRLLHHHARPDRLRHLRTRGCRTGHRLPPRSLLPTTHCGTSCCRVHLWSGAPVNFESLLWKGVKNIGIFLGISIWNVGGHCFWPKVTFEFLNVPRGRGVPPVYEIFLKIPFLTASLKVQWVHTFWAPVSVLIQLKDLFRCSSQPTLGPFWGRGSRR